jgi:hypothetical protein
MTEGKHYGVWISRPSEAEVRVVFSNPNPSGEPPEKIQGSLASAFRKGRSPEDAGIERTLMAIHRWPHADGDEVEETYAGRRKFWLVFRASSASWWPLPYDYNMAEAKDPFQGDPKAALRKMPKQEPWDL